MGSPARNQQQRQQSPLRISPFSRQAPMSPLRMRRQEQSVTTPTKSRNAYT